MSFSKDEPESGSTPIIARIVFNSLTHAGIKGFRGPMESQQIVFEAGDLSIHLRVSKPEEDRVILGKIMQESPNRFISSTTVNLMLGSNRIDSTVTNSLGEFRFGRVPAGALTLEARIAPRVVIANFKVIGD